MKATFEDGNARRTTGLRDLVVRRGLFPSISCEDPFHHVAMDIGQPEVAALEAVRESRVIDAEAVQERGVEIVDVDRIAGDVEAVVVCFAVGDTRTNASPASHIVKQRP